MFDLIWILFIIITFSAIIGILLMFKKFLSSKKSESFQETRGRVEPGINGDLDTNEPQSVFNVRVIKADPNFDAPEQFNEIKQMPLPNYTLDNVENFSKHPISDVNDQEITAPVGNDYGNVYNNENEQNQTINNTNNSATAIKNTSMESNQDSYATEDVVLKDSTDSSNYSRDDAHYPPLKKGIWERILAIFSFRGRGHRGITERPASEYVRRPKSIETIALILVAPDNDPYLGSEIFSVIRNFDLPLVMGKDGFLEQVTTTYFGDEIEFSVANLIHPGSFDVPNVMQMKLPGILFFMDIPTPDYQKDTFDQMLRVAARFGNELGGTLLDQDKRPLTAQGVEALRHHIGQLDERLWFQAEFENK